MFFKRIKPTAVKLPAKYDKLTQPERREIREEYVRVQKGLCYYCEYPLSGEPNPEIAKMDVDSDIFPITFFKYPVHLHHSHDNGFTIGAVHCHCNAVMWQYEGE